MKRICSVEDCNRFCAGRGWCLMHYKRWRKNGDPTKTVREQHGLRYTTEYESWSGMRARCYRVTHRRYKEWGGRGIKVCDRWKSSFINFYNDMGTKPSPEHSIDRIDNNGDYEPSNCRWATPKEQSNNRRKRGYAYVEG